MKLDHKHSFLFIALISMLLIVSCSSDLFDITKTQEDDSYAATIDNGQLAREYLEILTTTLDTRIAGRKSELTAAEWISDSLALMGYVPSIEEFEYEVKGLSLTSQNIVAVKKGSSKKQIIVGAHYDCVGAGLGADDNGSGVAVIMETAENLFDVDLPYTVKFIFFGAEEIGKKGSTAYAANMTKKEINNTILMINLDSLIAGDKSYVYGSEGKDGKYRDWILEKSRELDLDFITQTANSIDLLPGTVGDWSDHFPFKELGIPYVYFESTNWNLGKQDGYTQVEGNYGDEGRIWHTKYDTVEYIDETFEGRVDEKLSSFVTLLMKTLQHKFRN